MHSNTIKNMNPTILFDLQLVSSEATDIIVAPNKEKISLGAHNRLSPGETVHPSTMFKSSVMKCQAAGLWSRLIYLRGEQCGKRLQSRGYGYGRWKSQVGKPEILTPLPPRFPLHPLQQSNDSVRICNRLCQYRSVNIVTIQHHSLLCMTLGQSK